MQYPRINQILKDTKFSLNVFKEAEIQLLEERIIESVDKKGLPSFSVECLKRDSFIDTKINFCKMSSEIAIEEGEDAASDLAAVRWIEERK